MMFSSQWSYFRYLFVLIMFSSYLCKLGYGEDLELTFNNCMSIIMQSKEKDIPNPNYHIYENTKDIIALGPKVLPNVYNTLLCGDPYLVSYLSYAVQVLSKKVFLDIKGMKDDRMGYPNLYAQLWVDWWEKERFDIAIQFEERYAKWKQESLEFRFLKPTAVDYTSVYSHDQNKFKQWRNMPDGLEKKRLDPLIRTAYQQLLDLGIVSLPFAVEKIQEGDVDLIDAVNYWTDDALKKSAEEKGIANDGMREYCVKWWEENKENWLLPPIDEKEKQ